MSSQRSAGSRFFVEPRDSRYAFNASMEPAKFGYAAGTTWHDACTLSVRVKGAYMDAKVPHSDQGSARVAQATNLEPTSQLSARKMRECVRHTVGWLGLYLLICLSPLVLLALGAPS